MLYAWLIVSMIMFPPLNNLKYFKFTYFFDDVPDSSLLGSTAFIVLIFGLFLLLLIIYDWTLDGHKFVQDGNIFHPFGLDFNPFFIIDIVSWINSDILTQRLHSTVHIKLFIFKIIMNLFV